VLFCCFRFLQFDGLSSSIDIGKIYGHWIS
jgi:hypothetical protein